MNRQRRWKKKLLSVVFSLAMMVTFILLMGEVAFAAPDSFPNESDPELLGGDWGVTIATDKAEYSVGEDIYVKLTGASSMNGTEPWIGLFDNTEGNDSKYWAYFSGDIDGKVINNTESPDALSGLNFQHEVTPGSYYVIAKDSEGRWAICPITIKGGGTEPVETVITTDKEEYGIDEDILVSCVTEETDGWVAVLAESDSINDQSYAWYYPTNTDGTVPQNLKDLPNTDDAGKWNKELQKGVTYRVLYIKSIGGVYTQIGSAATFSITDDASYEGYDLELVPRRPSRLWNGVQTEGGFCQNTDSVLVKAATPNGAEDGVKAIVYQYDPEYGTDALAGADVVATSLNDEDAQINLADPDNMTVPGYLEGGLYKVDLVKGAKHIKSIPFFIYGGHTYKDPVYNWSDDNKSVEAKKECQFCDNNNITETVETTSEVTKPSTCSEKGTEQFTAEFTKDGFTTQTKEVELPIDENAHKYGEWVSVDGDNHKKVCEYDETHVVTEPHNWNAGEITKEATCTEAGEKTFTCTDCGGTKVVPIDALGHEYKVSWDWAKNCKTAKAVFTCTHDSTHVETVDAEVEEEVTEAPTCTTAGKANYSATATFEGKEYTDDQEDAELAALGHAMTKTDAKAATCEKAGNSEYWTCGNCHKLFSDEAGTKEITEADTVVAKLGHDLTKTDAKAATCVKAGNSEYWTCKNCEKYFSDAEGNKEIEKDSWVIEATGEHTWNDGEVTTEPTYTEKGVKTYTCTVCGETKTEEIDALTSEAVKPVVKLSAYKYIYTGKVKAPKITVTVDGKTLAASDYNVTYNTKRYGVGKHTIKVTLKNSYEGSASTSFKIYPKKPVVSSAAVGKKKMTVKMKTGVSKTGAKVYQIAYRVKGTSKWKYTTTTKQSKVIKKLKKGKAYQVKVRAYKAIGKVKYFSTWSKVKTTKKIK